MSHLWTSSPTTLVDKRYDRMAICCIGLAWIIYSYMPAIVTSAFRPGEELGTPNLAWLWLPGAVGILLYSSFLDALAFRTVRDIVFVGIVGVAVYVFQAELVGFGIIDFSWYTFHFAHAAGCIVIRRFERQLVSVWKEIDTRPVAFSDEAIAAFRSTVFTFLGRMMKVYLAVVAILGVCMSILLSGSVLKEGVNVPAWQDWGRMQNALRMASLVLLEGMAAAIFFFAPLSEVVQSRSILLGRASGEVPGTEG